MFRQLAGVIVATLSSATVSHAQPVEKQFKDWLVGCDNVRTCRATGLISADPRSGTTTQFLVITRDAAPNAPVKIDVGVMLERDGPKAAISIAARGAKVDGLPLTLPRSDTAGTMYASATTADPTHTRALVNALRRSQALDITADWVADRQRNLLSLAGAAAALLYMDAVQQRLNTTTALMRVGIKGASAVPAPPVRPTVVADRTASVGSRDPKLAAAVRANRRALPPVRRSQWEQEMLTDPVKEPDDQVEPLGGRDALVLLQVGRGAYNFAYIAYYVPGGNAKGAQRLSFPAPGRTASSEVLVNAGFDPTTRKLGFFNKARGLGDCGTTGEYVWTGKGFALVEYAAMSICEGLPPELWPVLWRATIK